MKVAIIGHGNVGKHLAALLIEAKHDVVVGIRHPHEIEDTAKYPVNTIPRAIDYGDVVLIAIPYTACAEVLAANTNKLQGKIVVDVTNPLNADWSPLLLGEMNSAGEEIAKLLPRARVVKAFNTVFAEIMVPDRLKRSHFSATAFIAGDDSDALNAVADLAKSIGFSPVLTGPLKNARYLEGMAHLNISIAVDQKGGTNAAFLYDQRAAP
jgi:8-hydroxy-5-deazaflavin:NADPH oxidoreductase